MRSDAVRILLLSNLFPPDVLGGYELLARDVALLLRERGHELEVLTSGEPREDDPEWVFRELQLIRPFGEPGRLDRVRHFRASFTHRRVVDEMLARRPRYDAVLFASQRRLGLHAARALAGHGLPSVWLFNDDWLLAHRPDVGGSRLAALVERGPFAARTWRGVRVERAVYPAAAIREALRAGGAEVPDGVVRFQGVDRARFTLRERSSIGLRPRLLFVGRLHPTKGCEHALEALSILRRQGLLASLSIAGRGDPDYEASLRAHATALGVEGAVEWLGFVPREELPEVYRWSDVFLFPSVWEEPAGLTYLEAMASGVPVVAYARGGARELLVDGSNACLAENPEQMAVGITRLFLSPALVARVVEGGHRTVEEHATLEGYVDAIESELRSCLSPAKESA
ncbi:MAG: glycosyltransferase family 4 protein [Sandaracinaceae bacterium]|nr:glycosyltransferase family 4 protein [Sandaracinaceae bacterium]